MNKSVQPKSEFHLAKKERFRKQLTPIKMDGVSKIVQIATNKLVSMRDHLKFSRKSEIKMIVMAIITEYNDGQILTLTPFHIELIVDWIVSDYNPETGVGGVLGYTFEDIHLVFRMGMTGQFGKPSGHKYVMSEITGSKGWFEQYHDIRNVELGNYYHGVNRKLLEQTSGETDDKRKIIPCPKEISAEFKKIGKNEKLDYKQYGSVSEYCESENLDFIEFTKPYMEVWEKSFNQIKPKGKKFSEDDSQSAYQNFINYQLSQLIRRINIGLKTQAKSKK